MLGYILYSGMGLRDLETCHQFKYLSHDPMTIIHRSIGDRREEIVVSECGGRLLIYLILFTIKAIATGVSMRVALDKSGETPFSDRAWHLHVSANIVARSL